MDGLKGPDGRSPVALCAAPPCSTPDPEESPRTPPDDVLVAATTVLACSTSRWTTTCQSGRFVAIGQKDVGERLVRWGDEL